MRLWKRGGKGKGNRIATTGLSEADSVTLRTLEEQGADLAEPGLVVYHLDCSSQETAEAMAAEAAGRGFEAEVEEPLSSRLSEDELRQSLAQIGSSSSLKDESFRASLDQWSVQCRIMTALSPDVIRENTEFFESLASRYGAEYDGWEAEA